MTDLRVRASVVMPQVLSLVNFLLGVIIRSLFFER